MSVTPQTSSTVMEVMVTVPRAALQALAEWAYFPFCSDRISAKLPPDNPRRVRHTLIDDVHLSLQQDRMAFLKELFWKAEQEACRIERSADPGKKFGSPALETFMECVAAMDDPYWDEPLTRKALQERKKAVRTKQAEKKAVQEWMARLDHELEHPTPESAAKTMTRFRKIALFTIRESLEHEDPEIRLKAQEEIRHFATGLQELQAS